jgi:hypothetical protein
VLPDQFFGRRTFQIGDTQLRSATHNQIGDTQAGDSALVDMTRSREFFTTPAGRRLRVKNEFMAGVRDEGRAPAAAARQVPEKRQFFAFFV